MRCPTFTWIFVSEPIDHQVPDRPELFDHHTFAEGYPDVVYDQGAAVKILKIDVDCLVYGCGVLSQAIS
jgi:hypothetical protein